MRFKIKKSDDQWFLFKWGEDWDGSPAWRYLNRYDTFEEARAKTANFVDVTVRVLGSFKNQ